MSGYTCTAETADGQTILTNTKNPPEPSEAPNPSVTPKPSDIPQISEVPKPSETPQISDTPKLSVTPKPSDTPKASVTPEPSETPQPSIPSEPGITGDADTPQQTDTQEQTPKTGDTGPVEWWFFLLVISLLGITGILTVTKRIHSK